MEETYWTNYFSINEISAKRKRELEKHFPDTKIFSTKAEAISDKRRELEIEVEYLQQQIKSAQASLERFNKKWTDETQRLAAPAPPNQNA